MMRLQRKLKEYNKTVLFIVNQLKDKPLQTIANELNTQGFKTTKGMNYTPVQVHRLIKHI